MNDIQGIGPANVEKLKEAGYTTIHKIAVEYPETLAKTMGWGTGKCREIVEDAKKLTVESLIPIKTMVEIKEERARVQYITTGSKALDGVLGGKGIETDSITGLAGKLGSGKSQTCFSACVSMIAMGRKCVYVETEASIFRADRLEEIAKARGLDIDIENNMLIIPAKYLDVPDKLLLAYERIEKYIKDGNDVGLVCIDSFAAPFRAYYTGREQFPERSKMIFRQMAALQKLASDHNLAVIVTNQVMSVPVSHPAEKAMLIAAYGSDKMPALGDSMLHSVTIWVSLTKTGKENWKAIVFDAPHLPTDTVNFKIDKSGVTD